MGLKEDAKHMITRLFGPGLAAQVDRFQDPEKYPNDFLEECDYFLSALMGREAAQDIMQPLVRKYAHRKVTV